MRPQGGYVCISDPEAGVVEYDTFTCYHCQRVVRVGGGGFCRVCDAMICDKCVGLECVPFMRKIEKMEEAAYRRRQAAL